MASPDRVTDELVEARLKIYSDPGAQESLGKMFANSFGQGKTSRRFTEDELSEIKAPRWSFGQRKSRHGSRRGKISGDPDSRCGVLCDARCCPLAPVEHPEEHDQVVLSFLKTG